MDRRDFQKLALEHLADARAMLRAKRWGGAYYLTGYAVECGLKACILLRVAAELGLLFEDRRFQDKCWTHNLTQLLGLTGLSALVAADIDLDARWNVVNEWDEASRYERRTRRQALGLYAAVTDKKHGVLTWLKTCW
jgi:hypothetical protein